LSSAWRWDHLSSFPPSPKDCFCDDSPVAQFVIQPWYRTLYEELITRTECSPRSAIVMGTPEIGKSVFCLEFMTRLIATEVSIFGFRYLVMTWLQDKNSERRWISVIFNGEVTAITRGEFWRDAACGAFAIFDGIAFDKRPIIHTIFRSYHRPNVSLSQWPS
jgi:hypothetical protein